MNHQQCTKLNSMRRIFFSCFCDNVEQQRPLLSPDRMCYSRPATVSRLLLTSSFKKLLHNHLLDIQVGERGRNIKTLTRVWRPSCEATADQGELFKKRFCRCRSNKRVGFGGGIEEEEGWIMKRCRVPGIHPVVQTFQDSDVVLGLTLESWRGLTSGFGSSSGLQ